RPSACASSDGRRAQSSHAPGRRARGRRRSTQATTQRPDGGTSASTFPARAGRAFTSNRKAERMTDFDVVIRDSATDAEVAELRDAIHEFNYAATGYRDGLSLSCFLRADDGALVAGIDGFTWGGYARVDYLWVAESLRGRGLGSRLLAAAEGDALRRGCV